jgi:hypothetical protein
MFHDILGLQAYSGDMVEKKNFRLIGENHKS